MLKVFQFLNFILALPLHLLREKFLFSSMKFCHRTLHDFPNATHFFGPSTTRVVGKITEKPEDPGVYEEINGRHGYLAIPVISYASLNKLKRQ